jgi:hypothetical protein
MSQPNVPNPLLSPYQASSDIISSTSNQPLLLQPTPVHAGPQLNGNLSQHMSMIAPQMMPITSTQAPADEGKMSVAIDFGAWNIFANISSS